MIQQLNSPSDSQHDSDPDLVALLRMHETLSTAIRARSQISNVPLAGGLPSDQASDAGSADAIEPPYINTTDSVTDASRPLRCVLFETDAQCSSLTSTPARWQSQPKDDGFPVRYGRIPKHKQTEASDMIYAGGHSMREVEYVGDTVDDWPGAI